MNELAPLENRFKAIEQSLLKQMKYERKNSIDVILTTYFNHGLHLSSDGTWSKVILGLVADISKQDFVGIIEAYASINDSDYYLISLNEANTLKKITTDAVNALSSDGGIYSDLAQDSEVTKVTSEYSQRLVEARAEFDQQKKEYLEKNLQTLAIALITTLEEFVGE